MKVIWAAQGRELAVSARAGRSSEVECWAWCAGSPGSHPGTARSTNKNITALICRGVELEPRVRSEVVWWEKVAAVTSPKENRRPSEVRSWAGASLQGKTRLKGGAELREVAGQGTTLGRQTCAVEIAVPRAGLGRAGMEQALVEGLWRVAVGALWGQWQLGPAGT